MLSIETGSTQALIFSFYAKKEREK